MPYVRTEESKSFAVGHLALGYILGKGSSRLIKTKINIPVILTLSVIPDVDMIIPFVEHRGPTHSVLMAFLIFIPIFAVYRNKAIPYFLALIQHPLLGDYMSGGRVQLLWPLTTQYYGIELGIKSQTNITIEWMLFLASIIIMLKAKDTTTFFQPHDSNLILSIPALTALLPTFLSFPLDVPMVLILPHLTYLFIFSYSIAIDVKRHLIH
jgi:hypothetical protein